MGCIDQVSDMRIEVLVCAIMAQRFVPNRQTRRCSYDLKPCAEKKNGKSPKKGPSPFNFKIVITRCERSRKTPQGHS